MTGVRRVPYRVVDAFAERPFSGNPAGVVLPVDVAEGGIGEGELDDATRQAIAAELNLSETAFPGPARADGTRELRWFTPSTEVSLCGHATLAAAHALAEAGAGTPLRFDSKSGALEVDAVPPLGSGAEHSEIRSPVSAFRLDFPADLPTESPPPGGLMEALGLGSGLSVRYASGERCALLELPDGALGTLRALAPDFRALLEVELPPGVMGVSVTAATQGEPGLDFESRFFGPWVGVDEDPVTGMAHCLLGPWWSRRLGTDEFSARQGGLRGGRLSVRVRGDRVHLVGRAVTVADGHLFIPSDR